MLGVTSSGFENHWSVISFCLEEKAWSCARSVNDFEVDFSYSESKPRGSVQAHCELSEG